MKTEQRILQHIMKVQGLALRDGKEKIVIVKIAKGLSDHDLSYLYTTAHEAKRLYSCLLMFVFGDDDNSHVKTWQDYVDSMSTEALDKIRDEINKVLAKRMKVEMSERIRESEVSFAFIDLSMD